MTKGFTHGVRSAWKAQPHSLSFLHDAGLGSAHCHWGYVALMMRVLKVFRWLQIWVFDKTSFW